MSENKIQRIKLIKVDSEELYEKEIFQYDENSNLTIVCDMFDKYALGLNMFYDKKGVKNVASLGYDQFSEELSEHIVDTYTYNEINSKILHFKDTEKLLNSDNDTINLLLEASEFSQRVGEISSRIKTLKLNENISDIVIYPTNSILAFREESNTNYTIIRGKKLYAINIKPEQIEKNSF